MWSFTWDCCHERVSWDRALSDPVVLRFGGQACAAVLAPGARADAHDVAVWVGWPDRRRPRPDDPARSLIETIELPVLLLICALAFFGPTQPA
jgi:hypothetical protein